MARTNEKHYDTQMKVYEYEEDGTRHIELWQNGVMIVKLSAVLPPEPPKQSDLANPEE